MTLHPGIDGSAGLRGTFVSGRDLVVKTVGLGRPCCHMSEPIKGGTNRPNTEYHRAGVVRRRFQAQPPIHPRKSK